MDNANWKCWVCYAINELEVGSSKRKLTCPRCESVYIVTGKHIDGRPMIGLLGARAKWSKPEDRMRDWPS